MPLTVAARPTRPLRIGFLGNGSPATGTSSLDAFRRGLHELGWVEGQGVKFELRWADGRPDRLAVLVAELVQAKVDVLVIAGPAAIDAAQRATSTIPVVFVVLIDPVTVGFVRSLAHPGGNMTGLGSHFEELITKHLQLLKEAVPKLSRVALLRRPESAGPLLTAAESAAHRSGRRGVADVAPPVEQPCRNPWTRPVAIQ
jgi:putative tryptophan/tyrosine transport system substrate-binding protein